LQDEPRGFVEGERIAKVSVWTLVAIGLAEIASSLFTGSVALLADGIDSISDAGVNFFVWTGLRFVRRRPTHRFQYGYYKVETFTAFITGVVLIPVSLYILFRSYRAFLNPVALHQSPIALAVLAAAGIGSLYRALQMRRIANRYNILSLKLDAKNSIKDTTSSFVAFVSVFLASIGIYHADAIGGMLVALYILSVAYVTIKESSLVLLDEFHEPELAKEIESVIRSHAHVLGIRDLRLRRAGPFIVGSLEVEVDGTIPLNQAHEVASQIESRVMAVIKGIRRFVVTPVPHFDPHEHLHEHYRNP